MSPATLDTVSNLIIVQFNLISTNIPKLGYEWLGHGRSLLVYVASWFYLINYYLAISAGYHYICMFISTLKHFINVINLNYNMIRMK